MFKIIFHLNQYGNFYVVYQIKDNDVVNFQVYRILSDDYRVWLPIELSDLDIKTKDVESIHECIVDILDKIKSLKRIRLYDELSYWTRKHNDGYMEYDSDFKNN